MNVRKLARQSLLGAAIAMGTLPIAAAPASAGSNGGCGTGFTESSVDFLANYAVTNYGAEDPNYSDWFAAFSGLDKNGDGSLCWHQTGKTCPCGAQAINVVDDNANASNN